METLKSAYFWELRKAKALAKKIYGGKRNIKELPNALQQYLIQSGFETCPRLHSAEIHWKNTFLKFSENGKWKSISCIQQNFLPDPIRLIYMKTKLMGLFGLEALDSFRHGKGNMRIRALGIFGITDAKGEQMDRSELVTILAETMIIPDYALYSYIHWEELDICTIKGTISYYGMIASGVFYLNENFEMIRFETNDRYLTKKDGSFQKAKWTATVSNFIKCGKLKFPSSFTATWNKEGGDFWYFRGEVSSIKLNE